MSTINWKIQTKHNSINPVCSGEWGGLLTSLIMTQYLARPNAWSCIVLLYLAVISVFCAHIWPSWLWSSGVSLTRSCKMQLTWATMTAQSKVMTYLIFARFPQCNVLCTLCNYFILLDLCVYNFENIETKYWKIFCRLLQHSGTSS